MTRDIWRYRCPNNHASWQERRSELNDSGGNYYCESCLNAGLDPNFDELKDMKQV